MIRYRLVPGGLSAFGVELTMPGEFRSVRGFASVAEAHAWVVEQDKVEARRIASAARQAQAAAQLIERNRALRCQAERVWHQTGWLCSPLLMSRVIPVVDEAMLDELIERNHRLLARAARVCARARQVNQITAAHLVQAQQALVLRQAARAARAASRASLLNRRTTP
jgi:hypothetical protein